MAKRDFGSLGSCFWVGGELIMAGMVSSVSDREVDEGMTVMLMR